MSDNHSRYVEEVKAGLQAAYDRVTDERVLDVGSARLIVFSDLHRGARNRADDFQKCERAYNAALAYYFRLGYTLVGLGDMEELWEERAKQVREAYRESLELEARFHRDGRYLRIWGNHDDKWARPAAVRWHLDEIFGHDPQDRALQVLESLRFRVVDGNEELGELFLTHGHQGTTWSDKFAKLGRFLVRYGWRPIQRLTGYSPNTPATQWELRHRHNVAMHEWAAARDRFVLVTGHTHRPVYESQSHLARVEKDLAEAQARLKDASTDPALLGQVAELEALKEWIRSQDLQEPDKEPAREPDLHHDRPSYFNTGCCCYSDGDVTGLEIVDREIRLVRWPDDEGNPRPKQLVEKPSTLRQIFTQCEGATNTEPAPE